MKNKESQEEKYYCKCEHCEETRRQQTRHGKWQALKDQRQPLIYR